jgi:hypothetical protein
MQRLSASVRRTCRNTRPRVAVSSLAASPRASHSRFQVAIRQPRRPVGNPVPRGSAIPSSPAIVSCSMPSARRSCGARRGGAGARETRSSHTGR